MTGLEWLRSKLNVSEQDALDYAVASGVTITDQLNIDPNNPGPISVRSVLSHLFVWGHSPQGHQFWDDLATRYDIPAFKPGDFVEALEDFPQCFTKGNVYAVIGVRPSSSVGNVPLLDISHDDSGRPNSWLASKFALVPCHHTGAVYASAPAPAAKQWIVGDFKFTEPKEETPEEVRKSRADAIWEALHSVAKPN